MRLESRQGQRVEGKVALVAGGASGIGAESCRRLAAEGAVVVVADVNDRLGKEVARDIERSGGSATYVHLDVEREDDWARAMGGVVSELGRLDVGVNSAGRTAILPIEETSREEWDRAMANHATGVFLGTKFAAAEMVASGGGSIVNVSSIYGIVGSTRSAAYHAAKGAIRAFSKAAAVRYAPDNVRVNSVYPGFTDTAMTARLHSQPAIRSERLEKTPLGRLGVPEDIAWGIVYLASDESSFVTGAELVIDGGMIAR